jgi:hypothetical protein
LIFLTVRVAPCDTRTPWRPFYAPTLLVVNDPLLAGCHHNCGRVAAWCRYDESKRRQSVGGKAIAGVEFEVASGKPAPEIASRAHPEHRTDRDGLTATQGFRKRSSVPRRALSCETTVPTP